VMWCLFVWLREKRDWPQPAVHVNQLLDNGLLLKRDVFLLAQRTDDEGDSSHVARVRVFPIQCLIQWVTAAVVIHLHKDVCHIRNTELGRPFRHNTIERDTVEALRVCNILVGQGDTDRHDYEGRVSYN